MKRGFIVLCILTLAVFMSAPGYSAGVNVDIIFNTVDLGLGLENVKFNDGGTRDSDIPGKIVTGSPGSGTASGSQLFIQTNGEAGLGTATDPFLVTVSFETRLDNTLIGDYQAAVPWISKDETKVNNGQVEEHPEKEGLGVRAFTIDTALPSPTYHRTNSLEGSKEISGGTDPGLPHNDPAHVDERVKFQFSDWTFEANSTVVTLSKFDTTDILDLYVKFKDSTSYLQTSLGVSDLNEVINDKLYQLVFNDLGFDSRGIDFFTIAANDDNPNNPSGTAEHFLIGALSGTAVPIPGAVWLLGSGLVCLVSLRKKLRG